MPHLQAPIAFFDLHTQHAPLRGALLEAVQRVLDSERYILGEEVTAFEQEMAAMLGVNHVIGVSSGSDALYLALLSLDIGPGDEVITSPFTFFATAGAILRTGATPVFVDIEADTFNIDTNAVAAAMTPNTRAVIPVHLFGQPCDLTALRALCDRHNCHLVEDAAQAIGATWRGAAVGSVGELSAFSLFPAKNLGAFGDAGFVTTPDSDLAERVRMLRVHGSRLRYQHELIGGNYRLDALQAAMVRVKLPLLPTWTNARRHNAARYDALFAQAQLPPEILRTPTTVDPGHVYNQYTLRVADRDGLQDHLNRHQIGCEIYYPRALHQQSCFADLQGLPRELPRAEQAAREVLSIPIYPELKADSLERVAETIIAWARGQKG